MNSQHIVFLDSPKYQPEILIRDCRLQSFESPSITTKVQDRQVDIVQRMRSNQFETRAMTENVTLRSLRWQSEGRK